MAQLRATLDVYRESLASDPALDTAVSHALLRSVDAGEQSESLRLYTPGDALAFSVLDRPRPGFARAVALAREKRVRLGDAHDAAVDNAHPHGAQRERARAQQPRENAAERPIS